LICCFYIKEKKKNECFEVCATGKKNRTKSGDDKRVTVSVVKEIESKANGKRKTVV
jgi:hypothetical protein